MKQKRGKGTPKWCGRKFTPVTYTQNNNNNNSDYTNKVQRAQQSESASCYYSSPATGLELVHFEAERG